MIRDTGHSCRLMDTGSFATEVQIITLRLLLLLVPGLVDNQINVVHLN